MWPMVIQGENTLLSPDEKLSQKGVKFFAQSLTINICFLHHLHFQPPIFTSFIVSMISNSQDLGAIQLEAGSLIKYKSTWVEWIRARKIKTRDSRHWEEYSKRSGQTTFQLGENCLPAGIWSQGKRLSKRALITAGMGALRKGAVPPIAPSAKPQGRDTVAHRRPSMATVDTPSPCPFFPCTSFVPKVLSSIGLPTWDLSPCCWSCSGWWCGTDSVSEKKMFNLNSNFYEKWLDAGSQKRIWASKFWNSRGVSMHSPQDQISSQSEVTGGDASPQTPSFICKEIKEVRKGGGNPQHLVAQLLN